MNYERALRKQHAVESAAKYKNFHYKQFKFTLKIISCLVHTQKL